jgi:hypothetical protein
MTHVENNYNKMIEELRSGKYDILMLVSGTSLNAPQNILDEFVDAVFDFTINGGGLFICADNDPFFAQANLILWRLFGIELTGNTPGKNTLKPGNPNIKGHYDSDNHMITVGIDSQIYEGITICYPKQINNNWCIFGTSSDDHPVLISSKDEFTGGKNKPGRVLIDCGFTKFYDGYFEKRLVLRDI